MGPGQPAGGSERSGLPGRCHPRAHFFPGRLLRFSPPHGSDTSPEKGGKRQRNARGRCPGSAQTPVRAAAWARTALAMELPGSQFTFHLLLLLVAPRGCAGAAAVLRTRDGELGGDVQGVVGAARDGTGGGGRHSVRGRGEVPGAVPEPSGRWRPLLSRLRGLGSGRGAGT